MKHPSLIFPLNAFNLTGTQAAGANIERFMSAVHICLDFSDVGFPLSVRFAVRMGNILTEGNALTAEFTFSHFFCTSII